MTDFASVNAFLSHIAQNRSAGRCKYEGKYGPVEFPLVNCDEKYVL